MVAAEMGALGLRDRRPRLVSDYESYFATGLYDSRYPVANEGTLRTVVGLIGQHKARVLDFGCGSGRYAGLLVDRTSAEIIAYDTSPTALDMLKSRFGRHVRSGRMVPVGGDLDELARHVRSRGQFDVILLLFGVLGHIAGRDARVDLLSRLCRFLQPGGTLLLSVPNVRRRFRAEQARSRELVLRGELEPGDVLYTRTAADGSEIRMFYHLYTPAELRQDLDAAGFRLSRLEAESIMPERTVVASRPLAVLDRLVRRMTPVSLGYGLLAIANPMPVGRS
jgi:SAM-dependent methyltransferase